MSALMKKKTQKLLHQLKDAQKDETLDYISLSLGSAVGKGLSTLSRKGDECWLGIFRWRQDHADQDLSDIDPKLKDKDSTSSGHHW